MRMMYIRRCGSGVRGCYPGGWLVVRVPGVRCAAGWWVGPTRGFPATTPPDTISVRACHCMLHAGAQQAGADPGGGIKLGTHIHSYISDRAWLWMAKGF